MAQEERKALQYIFAQCSRATELWMWWYRNPATHGNLCGVQVNITYISTEMYLRPTD